MWLINLVLRNPFKKFIIKNDWKSRNRLVIWTEKNTLLQLTEVTTEINFV